MLTCVLPSFYLTEGQPVIQFEELFAVARLANKYGIDDIQAQALSCLEDSGYFSSDVDHFRRPDPTKVSVQPVHAIGAVILARLTNTPSMLPAALYRCTALGGAVIDGWARADGTTEHLSRADLKCCINARATLAEDGWRVFCLVFDERVDASCLRRDECAAGLRWVRGTILNGEQSQEQPALRDWTREILRGRLDHRFCRLCENALQGRNQSGMYSFWAKLPGRFGLVIDGWR